MPGNGYPMRLLLPGYQGNMNVKFLRRLKVVDQPAMSCSKARPTRSSCRTARRGGSTSSRRSRASSPTRRSAQTLKGPGYYEISGVAYSGNGRIAKVMVSADGGKSWGEAALQGPVHPQAFTRFRHAVALGRPARRAAKPRLGRGRQRAAAAHGLRGGTRRDQETGHERRRHSPTSTTTASQAGASAATGRSSMSTRKSLLAASLRSDVRCSRGRRRDAQARQADHRSRYRRLGHRGHAGRHRLAARQRHGGARRAKSMRRSASPAMAKAARAAARPARPLAGGRPLTTGIDTPKTIGNF